MRGRFEVDDFDEKAIFLCQFCGGDKCDQENYLKNKILPNAIEGLHSNWITDNILAMQRPSERLIKEYNLYAKFKDKNIRTVLNLQEPGEVGPSLLSTLFAGTESSPQLGSAISLKTSTTTASTASARVGRT